MNNTASCHDVVRLEMMFADPKYKDGIPVEWASVLRREKTYRPGILIKYSHGYGITSLVGPAPEFRVYLGDVNLDGYDGDESIVGFNTRTLCWRLKEDNDASH